MPQSLNQGAIGPCEWTPARKRRGRLRFASPRTRTSVARPIGASRSIRPADVQRSRRWNWPSSQHSMRSRVGTLTGSGRQRGLTDEPWAGRRSRALRRGPPRGGTAEARLAHDGVHQGRAWQRSSGARQRGLFRVRGPHPGPAGGARCHRSTSSVTRVEALADMGSRLSPSTGDPRTAVPLAERHGLTFHDAACAAVAQRRGVELWTLERGPDTGGATRWDVAPG